MKKLTTTLFAIMSSMMLFGQTGPGGVGTTDGSSTLELWLDASSITDFGDTDAVDVWPDQSGYDNNAEQTVTPSRQPTLQYSQINGNASMNFDGDDRMLGSLPNPTDAPVTILSVAYFGLTNEVASGTTNAYVFAMGSASANSHVSIARRNGSDAGNEDKFYNYDGAGSPQYGSDLTGQQWYVLSESVNTTSTFLSMYLDGASETITGGDYGASMSTSGNYYVGRYSGDHSYLTGDIAEIIVFTKVLNTAELNIVHSYLGAKYAISVTGNKFSSDPDDNDLAVAGIGTEADGSNSTASSAGINLTINSNFDNTDYLMFGHNDASNGLNNSDITLNSGSVAARWIRDWYIDVTDGGGAMTADMVFDFGDAGIGGSPSGTATNYRLLYRATSSGNWDDLGGATGTSGDQVTFSTQAFASDGYYTIATTDVFNSPLEFTTHAGDGPGGVGTKTGSQFDATNLALWLDASTISGSDNDIVSSWSDQSGNANDASQGTGGLEPRLQTNELNSNSVVRFDGTDDYMEGAMSSITTAPVSVVSVAYFSALNQSTDNDYVFSLGQPGTSDADQHLGVARRRSGGNINEYYCWDGSGAHYRSVISGQVWHVLSQTHDVTGSTQFLQMHLDGAVEATSSDYGFQAFNLGTNYSIGDWVNHGNSAEMNGDIAEIAVYSKVLNTAELNIVHSYFGAKYDLTVTGDKYAGDDFANDDNDFNVFGIGTEADGSNATGSAVGLSLTINSGFDNGEYVMAGHNDATNSINTSDINLVSGSIEGRWDRDWYVNVTGTGMTVDISFDFSNSIQYGGIPDNVANYRLIRRAGTSGDWTSVATANAIYGDQVEFDNVTLNDGEYYALATTSLSLSPLPVELTSFEASKRDQGTVEITWSTSSELNNDRFEIEKSADGSQWEYLASVPGAGTSLETRNYVAHDYHPYPQMNYYRLKQVDIDGAVNYSNIISVDMELVPILNVYPNPSSGTINLEGDIGGLTELRIYNILGQEVIRHISIKQTSGTKLEIDIEGLQNGVYMIKSNLGVFRILKI